MSAEIILSGVYTGNILAPSYILRRISSDRGLSAQEDLKFC
jgi:hypothetical protein